METRASPDGIYTVYFTGLGGTSFGMFLLKDGMIAGADPVGGLFDGNYHAAEDGNGWEGIVSVVLPAGQLSILGQSASPTPRKLEVPIKLPKDFDSGRILRIETVGGPINTRFTRVRAL